MSHRLPLPTRPHVGSVRCSPPWFAPRTSPLGRNAPPRETSCRAPSFRDFINYLFGFKLSHVNRSGFRPGRKTVNGKCGDGITHGVAFSPEQRRCPSPSLRKWDCGASEASRTPASVLSSEHRKLCPLQAALSSLASGPLEHVHLSLPFVTTKNKEVNATAVLWPSQVGTLTYVWWYGNNTEVRGLPAGPRGSPARRCCGEAGGKGRA